MENEDKNITVKEILKYGFKDYCSSNEVMDYQLKEVEKAINCYEHENGCYLIYCKHCDKFIFQSLGCNSRICSCCGKRYTDQWSNSLAKAMFSVSHRHFVMSVPDDLWPFLRDWNMMKIYMDSAINSFNEFFTIITHRKINVGVIVVLHPFGKDMKFQPHLHLLITEGGFDKNGNFIKCSYVPADGFRKKWRYEVLKNFQSYGLPNELATKMYNKYPNGFYVWLHKRGRIEDPKFIINYVGRYVRHPAVANSRIFYFDGKIVKFFYTNNEDIRINVSMTIEQFITSLIQHIPPPQFKMIRYYGAYARRAKRKYGLVTQSSIRQLNLFSFGVEKTRYCPYCHNVVQFVGYIPKPPPKTLKVQRELSDWIRSNLLVVVN